MKTRALNWNNLNVIWIKYSPCPVFFSQSPGKIPNGGYNLILSALLTAVACRRKNKCYFWSKLLQHSHSVLLSKLHPRNRFQIVLNNAMIFWLRIYKANAQKCDFFGWFTGCCGFFHVSTIVSTLSSMAWMGRGQFWDQFINNRKQGPRAWLEDKTFLKRGS